MMRFAKPVGLFVALLAGASCGSSSKDNVGIPKGDLGKYIYTDGAMLDDFATGSSSTPDAATSGDAATTMVPTSGNSTPIIADGFPSGNNAVPDVGFITVTICAPGSTTNCATIDHISIDTGSVGLHILASEIPSSLLGALPPQTTGTGTTKNVAECYVYEDGYVFGSVRTTDLSIAGEKAANLPFMVIGDSSVKVPTDCTGMKNDGASVNTFGGKGIIGIAPYSPDCGSSCASGQSENPIYYGCTSSGTCSDISQPVANQLPNPVALFADNNGVVIDLPAIDDAGALNPTGTLYFGVNTQSNNTISTETALAATGQGGTITIDGKVGSGTKVLALFDSGTSVLAATSSGVTECSKSSDYAGLYCPTSVTTENVTFTGTSGSASTTFKIAPPAGLYSSFPDTATAFDDLAAPGEPASGGEPALDIYGFPFFFGHKLFFILEGATAGSITGPAYAL